MSKRNALPRSAVAQRNSSTKLPVKWDRTGEIGVQGLNICVRGKLADQLGTYCQENGLSPDVVITAALHQFKTTHRAPIDDSEFDLCATWEGYDSEWEQLMCDVRNNSTFYLKGSKMEVTKVTITEAFRWWMKCRLLHEGTGQFAESDGILALHQMVGDVVSDMEPAYWEAVMKRRNAALATPPSA